jgi:hypothetical protein
MASAKRPPQKSWFRSRGGRRFGIEFALIIVIKLILLVLLWYLVIKPQPRADTSPAAVEQHFTPSSRTEATP